MAGDGSMDVGKMASELLTTVGITALNHPVTYVKVLMQVGHEPIKPVPCKSWLWNKTYYYLPNVLQYKQHIRQLDGWAGLFTGVGPSITEVLIRTTVIKSLSKKLNKDTNALSEEEEENRISSAKGAGKEIMARCAGTIAGYPFKVITIRMMCQFVGRETLYPGTWQAIQQIYADEGILGFFSGLLPVLIGECVNVVISRLIMHLLKKYESSFQNAVPDDHPLELQNYYQFLASNVGAYFSYPYTLVGNLMTVNNTQLAAGNPPYTIIFSSWHHCYSYLRSQGQLARGSSLFWRVVPNAGMPGGLYLKN